MPPARERAAARLRTGFRKLDAGPGVLHRGGVTVLAGASSVGKSALAMAMMLGACAPSGAAAACFTSFYENGDLLLRLLAETGGVAPARGSQRRYGIAAFTEQLRRRGLYLYQGGGIVRPCEVVAERAREAAARSDGLGMLVIDPLLTSTPAMRSGLAERRSTALALQELAVELDIAVLVVMAVETAASAGGEARPAREQLTPLGFEPGLASIEMLLHRPAIYTRMAPADLAEVEIHRPGAEHPQLVSLRYAPEEGLFTA
jgi:replicative DNA helicase